MTSGLSGYNMIDGQYFVSPSIVGGPNDGFQYIDSASFSVARGYLLLDWITPSGPVTIPYKGSTYRNWDLLQLNGYNQNWLYDGVVAHETYGNAPGKGHQAQIEKVWGEVIMCGNLMDAYDHLAGRADWMTQNALIPKVFSGRALAVAASHTYVAGNRAPGAPVYEVSKPWRLLTASGDSPYEDVSLQTVYEKTYCDWSLF
ncbi:MAG: hypothetical protein OEZ65_10950 [Gemmatimonadota bacterium]|nr:hypothetical protein [Gemmatimonadota bacterium]